MIFNRKLLTAPFMALFFYSADIWASKNFSEELISWLEELSIPTSVVDAYKRDISLLENKRVWVKKSGEVLYSISLQNIPNSGASHLIPSSMNNALTRARHSIMMYLVTSEYKSYGFKNASYLLHALENREINVNGDFLTIGEQQGTFFDDSAVAVVWVNKEDVEWVSYDKISYENLLPAYCQVAYFSGRELYLQDSFLLASKAYKEILDLKCNVPPEFYVESGYSFLQMGDEGLAKEMAVYAFDNYLEGSFFSSQDAEMLGDILLQMGQDSMAERAYWSAIKKINR